MTLFSRRPQLCAEMIKLSLRVKMVLVSVRYLFYQSMAEKIKTWSLSFSANGESIVRLDNRVAI